MKKNPRQHSKQSSSIFTQDAISYGYISTAKYWLIYPIIYLNPLNNASLKAILLSGACVAYCMGFALLGEIAKAIISWELSNLSGMFLLLT